MRRADSYPAPTERRILGMSTDDVPMPKPSPRYLLAQSIRALNARLARLTPEQQRELQDDWNASWQELSYQRESAANDAAELEVVTCWAAHWTARLGS